MSSTATNSFGEDQGVLSLSIIERSGFSHRVDLNCSAYWLPLTNFRCSFVLIDRFKTLV